MTGGARLLGRTNKAELFRLRDGSVVKRYFTRNGSRRARADWDSLSRIQSGLGTVHRDGWSYRMVKPLWFDVERGMVCMEFAPGRTTVNLDRSLRKTAEFHAGVWLGLYHRHMLGDQRQGLVFTDYTVGNVLIDLDDRTVVTIDPGMTWPRRGSAYEDVVKHVHSLLMQVVLRRGGPCGAISSFVQGYLSIDRRRPDWLRYYRSVVWQFQYELRDFYRKSLVKCLAFSVFAVLWLPWLLLVVPALILRHRRSGRTNLAGMECASTRKE